MTVTGLQPRRFVCLAVAWCSLAAARVAVACPVCFAAEQRQLWAYFGTAVLLSLLPFVLFSVGVLWMYRERRRATTGNANGPQRTSSVAATGLPADGISVGGRAEDVTDPGR